MLNQKIQTMQSRTKLVNSNQIWNAKKRYKINEVVTLNSNIYQNTTGINTNPILNQDWILIRKSELAIVQFHEDFIADETGVFEVPEGIYIGNVFINTVSAKGSDWSQTLNIVEISGLVVGDLVTLTGRN